ncbi:LytTR family DNA-binding domain-containing protein [Flavihumibacter rivuli]|uniref:LytR/AlgR family response regulator transcription factor n=1 Tax=Flavihumibacter rivuli TaxID=2838156 RepID=UPI001BDE0ACB|nr:LytTR family DNA-binding domain-containing protein [Flavihumibacter rivuli]ULQ55929.1 LytTR family DNA-binding domain-containing protein [Flavihumibacter rivuli]
MFKLVIIEDEKYAANYLKELVKDLAKDMEVVEVMESIADAKKRLPAINPDLVLADIHLEDGLSFEIFESLQWKKPVIFITAYDAYAIRAFKVNGIDYLLKPIDEEELQASLDKFRNASLNTNLESLYSRILELQKGGNHYKERFAISIGNKLLSIPVKDIAYFFFQNKTCFIQLFDGQKYPYTESLDHLSAVLNPADFIRVNRNYLISHAAIDKTEVYAGRNISIQLNPPAAEGSIVVSKDRITEFKCWLDL